jgi:membrane-bound lytic murein transglycosylase D
MVDSAADEAALSAMRDLEFRSLGKRADRVRWIEPDLDGAPLAVNTASHGGPDAAPRFDIDVESFLSHRRVQYYVEYFKGPAQERFNVWLGRMARYEGMVLNLFRRYGLPEDLLYLGLIESGYSPNAVSRASAVGMWQFMSATGRRYGLRIDGWVDERRDPFKATDAAARHLADLKDQFGAWYLAAAAYNGGPTRVARGLRRLPGDGSFSDTTFFDLSNRRYLRPETRDYVPKLIAATLIGENPAQHGFPSPPRLAPLVFDEITVTGQTGLDVIAELADTTARAVMELNPQYFRGATPPGESAVVRVPRGSGTIVMQRYEDLPLEDRINSVEHRIRRGDTLGEIAEQYRVSLRQLMQSNPGIRPRRLRIGQRLTIPMSTSARAGG